MARTDPIPYLDVPRFEKLEDFIQWYTEREKLLDEWRKNIVYGVPLLDADFLDMEYQYPIYPLGSRANFRSNSDGAIEAVFCQFDGMVGADIGGPVGFVLSDAETVNWLVTNDFSESAKNRVVGLLPMSFLPTNAYFGWVITRGANIQALAIKAAETNTGESFLCWSGDNEVSSAAVTADTDIFARQYCEANRTSVEGYDAGELFVCTPYGG
jgi:hypothetical protein